MMIIIKVMIVIDMLGAVMKGLIKGGEDLK